MSDCLEALYADRYERVLVPAAASLEQLICQYFKDVRRVDRIYARAKGSDSFLRKARKIHAGNPKYEDPLVQIQDQLAARVIVFYKSDVSPATELVLKYFARAEQITKEPESDWSFGYFGVHFLLATPSEIFPAHVELGDAPRLFELQIRTLFQHAWSEANHDLGYKPEAPLAPEQARKLAFTAAQAWGADLIFDELHKQAAGGP